MPQRDKNTFLCCSQQLFKQIAKQRDRKGARPRHSKDKGLVTKEDPKMAAFVVVFSAKFIMI